MGKNLLPSDQHALKCVIHVSRTMDHQVHPFNMETWKVVSMAAHFNGHADQLRTIVAGFPRKCLGYHLDCFRTYTNKYLQQLMMANNQAGPSMDLNAPPGPNNHPFLQNRNNVQQNGGIFRDDPSRQASSLTQFSAEEIDNILRPNDSRYSGMQIALHQLRQHLLQQIQINPQHNPQLNPQHGANNTQYNNHGGFGGNQGANLSQLNNNNNYQPDNNMAVHPSCRMQSGATSSPIDSLAGQLAGQQSVIRMTSQYSNNFDVNQLSRNLAAAHHQNGTLNLNTSQQVNGYNGNYTYPIATTAPQHRNTTTIRTNQSPPVTQTFPNANTSSQSPIGNQWNSNFSQGSHQTLVNLNFSCRIQSGSVSRPPSKELPHSSNTQHTINNIVTASNTSRQIPPSRQNQTSNNSQLPIFTQFLPNRGNANTVSTSSIVQPAINAQHSNSIVHPSQKSNQNIPTGNVTLPGNSQVPRNVNRNNAIPPNALQVTSTNSYNISSIASNTSRQIPPSCQNQNSNNSQSPIFTQWNNRGNANTVSTSSIVQPAINAQHSNSIVHPSQKSNQNIPRGIVILPGNSQVPQTVNRNNTIPPNAVQVTSTNSHNISSIASNTSRQIPLSIAQLATTVSTAVSTITSVAQPETSMNTTLQHEAVVISCIQGINNNRLNSNSRNLARESVFSNANIQGTNEGGATTNLNQQITCGASNRNDLTTAASNRNDLTTGASNRNDLTTGASNRNDLTTGASNRNDLTTGASNRNDLTTGATNRNDLTSGNRNDLTSGNSNDLSSGAVMDELISGENTDVEKWISSLLTPEQRRLFFMNGAVGEQKNKTLQPTTKEELLMARRRHFLNNFRNNIKKEWYNLRQPVIENSDGTFADLEDAEKRLYDYIVSKVETIKKLLDSFQVKSTTSTTVSRVTCSSETTSTQSSATDSINNESPVEVRVVPPPVEVTVVPRPVDVTVVPPPVEVTLVPPPVEVTVVPPPVEVTVVPPPVEVTVVPPPVEVAVVPPPVESTVVQPPVEEVLVTQSSRTPNLSKETISTTSNISTSQARSKDQENLIVKLPFMNKVAKKTSSEKKTVERLPPEPTAKEIEPRITKTVFNSDQQLSNSLKVKNKEQRKGLQEIERRDGEQHLNKSNIASDKLTSSASTKEISVEKSNNENNVDFHTPDINHFVYNDITGTVIHDDDNFLFVLKDGKVQVIPKNLRNNDEVKSNDTNPTSSSSSDMNNCDVDEVKSQILSKDIDDGKRDGKENCTSPDVDIDYSLTEYESAVAEEDLAHLRTMLSSPKLSYEEPPTPFSFHEPSFTDDLPIDSQQSIGSITSPPCDDTNDEECNNIDFYKNLKIPPLEIVDFQMEPAASNASTNCSRAKQTATASFPSRVNTDVDISKQQSLPDRVKARSRTTTRNDDILDVLQGKVVKIPLKKIKLKPKYLRGDKVKSKYLRGKKVFVSREFFDDDDDEDATPIHAREFYDDDDEDATPIHAIDFYDDDDDEDATPIHARDFYDDDDDGDATRTHASHSTGNLISNERKHRLNDNAHIELTKKRKQRHSEERTNRVKKRHFADSEQDTNSKKNYIRVLAGSASVEIDKSELCKLDIHPRVLVEDIFKIRNIYTRTDSSPQRILVESTENSERNSSCDTSKEENISSESQPIVNKEKLNELRKLCNSMTKYVYQNSMPDR